MEIELAHGGVPPALRAEVDAPRIDQVSGAQERHRDAPRVADGECRGFAFAEAVGERDEIVGVQEGDRGTVHMQRVDAELRAERQLNAIDGHARDHGELGARAQRMSVGEEGEIQRVVDDAHGAGAVRRRLAVCARLQRAGQDARGRRHGWWRGRPLLCRIGPRKFSLAPRLKPGMEAALRILLLNRMVAGEEGGEDEQRARHAKRGARGLLADPQAPQHADRDADGRECRQRSPDYAGEHHRGTALPGPRLQRAALRPEAPA